MCLLRERRFIPTNHCAFTVHHGAEISLQSDAGKYIYMLARWWGGNGVRWFTFHEDCTGKVKSAHKTLLCAIALFLLYCYILATAFLALATLYRCGRGKHCTAHCSIVSVPLNECWYIHRDAGIYLEAEAFARNQQLVWSIPYRRFLKNCTARALRGFIRKWAVFPNPLQKQNGDHW